MKSADNFIERLFASLQAATTKTAREDIKRGAMAIEQSPLITRAYLRVVNHIHECGLCEVAFAETNPAFLPCETGRTRLRQMMKVAYVVSNGGAQ